MASHVQTLALNKAPAQRFVAGPSPLGKRGTMALVLLCPVLAVAAVHYYLPVFAAIAVLMVVVAGCSTLGARPFAVFGLVYSIPFHLTHHFVYRPNVGAGDGLAVYPTDVWVIWLLVYHIAERQNGSAKPLTGFGVFLVPLSVAHYRRSSLSHQVRRHGTQRLRSNRALQSRSPFYCGGFVIKTRQERAPRRLTGYCLCRDNHGCNLCGRNGFSGKPHDVTVLIDRFVHPVFRSAGFTTPTLAAGYMAALLPLVAVEYFFPISRARRLLAGLSVILGIAGLGCTLTRAALGILAVGSDTVIYCPPAATPYSQRAYPSRSPLYRRVGSRLG